MLLFGKYFQGYLAAESRTELLLTMLQRISRKTLKEGYLRLQTLWSLFVKISLGSSSHKIPLGSYCLLYHKGYYGKPFRGVLMSKGLMVIIFEATDCSGILVKVLWKISKTFRDGLWFPSTMLNFIVYLDSIVHNDFLAIFPC